jgi:Peptidase family M23
MDEPFAPCGRRQSRVFLIALAPATLAAAPAPPTLELPIACAPGRTCEVQHYVDRDPGPGAKDYRCGAQTYDGHSGLDIRLPDMAAQRRGVAVLAAAPGRVTRLRDGLPDISVRTPGAASIEQQECGNGVVVDHGGGWETQYCHLAKGSLAVTVGRQVKAGTPLGRVGLSGNTEYPHLHMTVRRDGRVSDPFAPDLAAGACAPQGAAGMWSLGARAALPYRPGAILNLGFSGAPVTMAQVEESQISLPADDSPYLIAYGRAIALMAGDVIEMRLTGPGGVVLAEARQPPMAKWRAQHLTYIGKKRPPAGWPPGSYGAEVKILRGGKSVASRSAAFRF